MTFVLIVSSVVVVVLAVTGLLGVLIDRSAETIGRTRAEGNYLV
jgi:hypothetical protein